MTLVREGGCCVFWSSTGLCWLTTSEEDTVHAACFTKFRWAIKVSEKESECSATGRCSI